MDIITINANGIFCQTTLCTIQKCTKLVELLNSETNIINVDMSMDCFKIILNFLRGYHDQTFLRKIPAEAKKLGLLLEDNEHVFINVGGRIFYPNKNKLESNFKFFKEMFEKHTESDLSYILIDRSPDIFKLLLEYIDSWLRRQKILTRIEPMLLKDLQYYGYNNLLDARYRRSSQVTVKNKISTDSLQWLSKYSNLFKKSTNFNVIKNSTKKYEITFDEIPEIIMVKLNPDQLSETTKTIPRNEIIQSIYCHGIELDINNRDIFSCNNIYYFRVTRILYHICSFQERKNITTTDLEIEFINPIDNIDVTSFVPYPLHNNINDHANTILTFSNENMIKFKLNECLDRYSSFHVKKLIFFPHSDNTTPIDISHIIIKNNDVVIAQMNGMNILKPDKNEYIVQFRSLIPYTYYCLTDNDDIEIEIYTNEAFTGKLHLLINGCFGTK